MTGLGRREGAEGGGEFPGGAGEIPTLIMHRHNLYGADAGLYYISGRMYDFTPPTIRNLQRFASKTLQQHL